MSSDNLLTFPRRPTAAPHVRTEVTLLVELDGNVLVAQLARALASEGLTFSTNPKTGRLRIHEIPAFIRKEP
jgi:hypothetical protein